MKISFSIVQLWWALLSRSFRSAQIRTLPSVRKEQSFDYYLNKRDVVLEYSN